MQGISLSSILYSLANPTAELRGPRSLRVFNRSQQGSSRDIGVFLPSAIFREASKYDGLQIPLRGEGLDS